MAYAWLIINVISRFKHNSAQSKLIKLILSPLDSTFCYFILVVQILNLTLLTDDKHGVRHWLFLAYYALKAGYERTVKLFIEFNLFHADFSAIFISVSRKLNLKM